MSRKYTLADSNATKQSENLHELGRIATAMGLNDMADRIHREGNEMQAEAEHIQLDLMARGIEP